MRITTKFNVVLGSVFAVGLIIAVLISHRVLQDNAQSEVITHAGMMMEAALAIRGYTIREIKPLLSARLSEEFLPQTVPSYAATKNFEALREHNPVYTYKEATLNPTNPRDKATDWETDIIMQFRNDAALQQIVGERNTPTGRALFLARPIRIKDEGCLSCHSTVDKAPQTLVNLYGPANGFGWKFDEVVGAQIVSVPFSLPVEKAHHAFVTFLGSLIAVFAALFLLINLMLRRMVIKPVKTITDIADEVSKGNLGVPAFDLKGKDEIASLSASFNRMRVSLEKAMRMLGD